MLFLCVFQPIILKAYYWSPRSGWANQINIFVSLFPGQEIFAHAGGRDIILYWTDFPPANIGVFSKNATRAAAKQILFFHTTHPVKW